MKELLLAFLWLTLYHHLFGQSSTSGLQDSLVARFNRNDFQGFYDLGSSDWKQNNKSDGIIGWLGYIKGQTGNVRSSVLSLDSGKTTYYKWDTRKKILSFVLKTNDGRRFEGFDFKSYHLPQDIIAASAIPTDNPLKSRLDSSVQEVTVDFMLTHHLVGLSIGVVSHGRKHIYNYGTVEKNRAELPADTTTFELASITKTFTGILLAQAVLDKKVNPDADIREYMPGSFPNLQYHGQPLRIINLANHTSGLPAELPNLDTFKSEFLVLKMYDSYTDEKFFADLRTVKIDTVPGTSYGYSNSGMKLLGIILEKAYGLSYAQLLKKYITGPIGMNNTRIANAISDTTGYTKGYDDEGDQTQAMPHVNFNMFGGAGAILSDSRDMLNYVEENIVERLPAVKLSHQQTFVGDGGALGMGWQIARKTVNGDRIWKSGGALGFRSYCAAVPDKKVGLIWLSNRGDIMEDELNEMADSLLAAAIKQKP
jgi:CubicO group peptidase (beta-lactamase class C family)